MLVGMTSFARRLGCCAAWILLLACSKPAPTGSADGASKRTEDPPSTEAPPPKLEGRVFLSQSVTEGGKPRALVDGTRLQLSFQEQANVSAQAGCNSLGGEYTVTGGKLVITRAALTELFCEQKQFEQDGWYSDFLESSPTIMVDGNVLVLEGKDTRLEYLDREEAIPFIGRTWAVETIVEPGGTPHAKWPKPATLVFGADGRVVVDAGCNAIGSTYVVLGKELTFTSMVSTMVHCLDPLINEQETAVLRLIGSRQPMTWEIAGDRLSLRRGDVSLELVAAKG